MSIKRSFFLPILFVSMISSNGAFASVINLSYSVQYTFFGGNENGNGMIQYNTDTGLAGGNMNFTTPPIDTNTAFWPVFIPVFGCLMICFDTPLGQTGTSLFDHSNGDISGTMIANFGLAGEATFSSHLIGTVATISGDFTGVDLSLLPNLPITNVTTNVLIESSSLGQATGSGNMSILGTGLNISLSTNYNLIGNPTALFSGTSVISSESTIIVQGDTNLSFDGNFRSDTVAEPSTFLLYLVGIFGLYSRNSSRREPS